MKINERGFWENNSTEGHGADPGLMNGLAKVFNDYHTDEPQGFSILDLGCGDGSYTLFLRNQGFNISGYDGNPFTEQITGGICHVADFSVPQNLGIHDWVLCLEVGEHIPQEYEKVFLDNVAKHAGYGVILSWAIPGQGGDGHVNCKSNIDVSMEMLHRGFVRKLDVEDYLRNCCAEYPVPCYWFRKTLMCFIKD